MLFPPRKLVKPRAPGKPQVQSTEELQQAKKEKLKNAILFDG